MPTVSLIAAPEMALTTVAMLSDRHGFQVPVDAQKPAVWKAAFKVMEAPPPKDTAVFLHCDLLPVNVLWSHGRITGLTDWNSIHRGSRAIDVGHCRRYLAALSSAAWAEQFRSLYTSIAGVTLDPWWDLYALLHHDDSASKWIGRQVAGRRPVDVTGMTSRVEVAIDGDMLAVASRSDDGQGNTSELSAAGAPGKQLVLNGQEFTVVAVLGGQGVLRVGS